MKAVEIPFLSFTYIDRDAYFKERSGPEGEGVAGATWDLDDRPLL